MTDANDDMDESSKEIPTQAAEDEPPRVRIPIENERGANLGSQPIDVASILIGELFEPASESDSVAVIELELGIGTLEVFLDLKQLREIDQAIDDVLEYVEGLVDDERETADRKAGRA